MVGRDLMVWQRNGFEKGGLYWGGLLLFVIVVLIPCGGKVSGESCSFSSDYTSEATCGNVSSCSPDFQGCRCESSGCVNNRFPPGVLRFSIDSWRNGKPRIQVTKNPFPEYPTEGKTEDANPPTDTSTTSYCLSLSLKDGVYEYALRELTTSCSSEVFYSGSLTLERMWRIQSLQVSMEGSPNAVVKFEDFSDSENGCLLGDVEMRPLEGRHNYEMVGPFDCGTNFEAIKLRLEPGAKFSLDVEVGKAPTCAFSVCGGSDPTDPVQNLLEPRVSCVQPCIGDTCFFELGYTNRFPTELITDPVSDSQSTDMGYKYHPSYSSERGIINIMFPSSCADLQANPKFLNSEGDFVRFDETMDVDPCNSSSTDHCSLHNYINSYSKSPSTLWTQDPYQDLAIMQHWRQEFGWDYENDKKIEGVSGYAGFRMQPMFFAPGYHDSVSIVPVPKYTFEDGVKDYTNWCWVLGVNFLDICTSLECRKSYDSISCPRSPGMHAVYTYFYTTLRINQKPGFDNFHRLSHLNHESGFPLDNAYRFTFTYQFEEVVETGTDELRHAVFPLPSPCMQDESRLVFFLETYDAQCGVHVKPPCPGGFCNPIISRMTESAPLRVPFQLPGSGCNTNGECRVGGRAGPTVGNDACQCAFNEGGWGAVGTCADHTCLALTDFGATTTWTQCASPSGADPMLAGDREDFLALRGDPLCACDGITECPQSEMISSDESWCSDGAFSPYCTPSYSLSGNTQKSLWKMDICHSGNPECGPTLPQSDGLQGCTAEWVENRCKFKEFSFQYGCAGVGDEKTTCRFIDTRSVDSLGRANDIREVLVPGIDFLSWKRGESGDQPAMDNKYDPDADGIIGITTEWFCFDDPDAPITQYKDCDDVPHCGVTDSEPFPLAGSCGCCGNGICDVAHGENCHNCPFDCMSGPEEGGSYFCCGEEHVFEDEVGVCANSVCNINSVGSTCSEINSCEGDVICPDCRGARVPLSIKLEFQDGTPITDGCEYFPLAQPICKFEEELQCISCGVGENQGCPRGQYCDLESCECYDECESFSCDTKSARDCGVGKKKCEGAECTNPPALNCRELGATACCMDCENTYSKSLRDVVSTICDDSYAPCCPEGMYPEEPNRCDCLPCEEDPENDPSLCGRDDPDSIFLDIEHSPNMKKVDIQRFNPFGCECVSCSYDNIECPDGYVLFPPQKIVNGEAERAKVEEWLSTASVFDCPTCVPCDKLGEVGSLFAGDHSLCKKPSALNSCYCSSCNWADLNCPISSMFPAQPTRSQLDIFKKNPHDYLDCFNVDHLCDASAGLARSSPYCDFECVPCACPYGTYLDPTEKSPCNFASCLPCEGVQSCGVGEVLVDADGSRVDPSYCSNPCNECQCTACSDDFMCLTDDGKIPNQFDWVVRADICNPLSCYSCKDILDCPAMGMAFDTSSPNQCKCRPCTSEIVSDADLVCSGFDQGVLREIASSETSCECIEKEAIKECAPRCGTKIAADGLSCEECPEGMSILECQKGWIPETCPPYHELVPFLSNDELKANDCSGCLPCHNMCTQDRVTKVGQCDWVVANEDCTLTNKRESCPPGQVVRRFGGSGLPDYPRGACPVCVDPKESCPCNNIPPLVTEDHFIVFVLEDPCQECVPFKVPLHVPNHTFISAEPSPNCDGTVIVKREPCPTECPVGQERRNPKDKCSCAPCAYKECPAGEKVNPKNPCECISCTCSDCMSALKQESEGLCVSVNGVTRCWGCADASGKALPSDGVCEKFFHCDSSDLCSPKLVECPACPKLGEAPLTPGWPATKWISPTLEDFDIGRLTCQDGLRNDEYCDPEYFCAEAECSCPQDCKPHFDSEANIWHACDSSALCLGPKSCEELGWAKCSGFIHRDGQLFELSPKPESFDFNEEGCSLSICDCEESLVSNPVEIREAKRELGYLTRSDGDEGTTCQPPPCWPGQFSEKYGGQRDPLPVCDGSFERGEPKKKRRRRKRDAPDADFDTDTCPPRPCLPPPCCECPKVCACFDTCTPYYNETLENWFFCTNETETSLCDEAQECPTCEEWALETGFEIDLDNEQFLPRSPDFPSSRDDQCNDACECLKEPCVQECSPRLGLQNTNATCEPCEPCPDECPPGQKRPVITFNAISLGIANNSTVDYRCKAYFDNLLSEGYELAYEAEVDDVVPSDICTILNGTNGASDLCICDVTRCACEDCTDCRVCYENQIGEICLDSPEEEFPYDAEFYYRSNDTICEDECILCPRCLDNETHVVHRRVIYCDDPILDEPTRQRCLDLDNQNLTCANNVLTCEDPCNCDDANPCVPVFPPDVPGDEFVFCNATFEQYNTTLANVSAGEVQCTECVPCECDDSVCGPNEYVDTDFLCGKTTTPFSCGVPQISAGLPCACAEDECEPCASCPDLRFDIWVSGTLFPTICDYGTILVPEDQLRNASECIETDCFSATKPDEVCQCNCVNCTEAGYFDLLCDQEDAPSICALNSSEITCNDYFREDFNPNLVYYFNDTSCSCNACPDTFEGCDPEDGLRPSDDNPCECEPCEDICDGICTISSGVCLEDGFYECVDRLPCNNSQPNFLNCSDFLSDPDLADLFPQCEPNVIFQNATCYTECINCTGDFCLYSVDGEPLFRPIQENERPVEGDPCICEECPEEYECPPNQTDVTLSGITLPDYLSNNETFMEQLEILLDQDPPPEVYNGSYYDDRCDEECIPCSNEICGFISDRLPALDGVQLIANPDDPCICEVCPFEEQCPPCPWCRPSDTEECGCEIRFLPKLGRSVVVCEPPPECEGLPPDQCNILFEVQEETDNATCLFDPLRPRDENPTAYRFVSEFIDNQCECIYSAIDPRTPDDTDETDTECPPRYCPPQGKIQTCQPGPCNETCVPCPDCPEGEYVPVVEVTPEDDPDGEWYCDGDQCKCVPCTKECPPGSYLHESTCTCIPCIDPCNQDNATQGLEVYVYPDDDSGNCTCVPCDEEEVGCTVECTDCAILIVENNVCVCDWCLPEEFSDATYDVYGREDCPLYDRQLCGTDGCDDTELVDINSLGVDSNNESICLCGLKGSDIDDVQAIEVPTCPLVENCGCCPERVKDCVQAGNDEVFCQESICVAQLSCDGTCSSSDPMMDLCGVMCGDGSTCTEDENSTVALCDCGYDQCGVCCGKNECLPDPPEPEDDGAEEAAAAAGSLVGLAGLAGLLALGGLLRRAHLQSSIAATFDAELAETLDTAAQNPLHQEQNTTFNMPDVLEDLG